MGNYKFIISGIIFTAFIVFVSFETGYKRGSQVDLSNAAEKASSSVVNIFISNRGLNNTRRAVGSGVIFSKEGHIVTNTHILTNARSVFVEFNDGEITEAVLIGADKYSDIAVLKISGFDKQMVGSIASKIKTLRKIEPYKGKGIKEKGQYILKKEGKKK